MIVVTRPTFKHFVYYGVGALWKKEYATMQCEELAACLEQIDNPGLIELIADLRR